MDIEETASNKRGGIPPEEREGKRLRPTEEIILPSQLWAHVLECKKFFMVHVICFLYGGLHIVYWIILFLVYCMIILHLCSSI